MTVMTMEKGGTVTTLHRGITNNNKRNGGGRGYTAAGCRDGTPAVAVRREGDD